MKHALSLVIFGLLLVGAIAEDIEETPEQDPYEEDEPWASAEETPMEKREAKQAPCVQAKNFDKKDTTFEFASSTPLGEDSKCDYTFVGSAECPIAVSCEGDIDIEEDADCKAFFLISDGVGGEKKLCAPGKLEGSFTPSKGARDLFVRFKTSKPAADKKGFKCKVTCATKDATELPKSETEIKRVPCVCGNKPKGKDDRIVGGEDAKKGEFPWQAAIVMVNTRNPICGATVLNDKYILTAAHCFYFSKMPPTKIQVLTGAYLLGQSILGKGASTKIKLGQKGSLQASGYEEKNITDKEDGATRYDVEEIILHPLFTPSYDFDIALLKLKDHIDLAADGAPVSPCIPDIAQAIYPEKGVDYGGQKATVSGWGLADEKAGGTTRRLQKLEIPLVALDECKKTMKYKLTQRMLCGGFKEGGKDACQGDSGGPLVHQRKSGQTEQIGVVSWGEGCARKNRLGMYAKVAEFVQWLNFHGGFSNSKWCHNAVGDLKQE